MPSCPLPCDRLLINCAPHGAPTSRISIVSCSCDAGTAFVVNGGTEVVARSVRVWGSLASPVIAGADLQVSPLTKSRTITVDGFHVHDASIAPTVFSRTLNELILGSGGAGGEAAASLYAIHIQGNAFKTAVVLSDVSMRKCSKLSFVHIVGGRAEINGAVVESNTMGGGALPAGNLVTVSVVTVMVFLHMRW